MECWCYKPGLYLLHHKVSPSLHFLTSDKLNNLCANVSLTFDNPYHYWIQITFQEPDYPHLSLENRKRTIWNVKCHVASIQMCLPVSQSLGLCTI